jgi:glycosyltransferase involved in cell wall biosynthesis
MIYSPSDKQYSILIFNQFFPPDFAATGQLIEELAFGISQQGIKVGVFSGQPGYAFETNKAPRKENKGKLKITRTRSTQLIPSGILAKLSSSVFYFLRAFLHTARHQSRHDLLIITTAPAFMTWLGYLAHLIWRKKYICLLYDLYPNVLISLNIFSDNHPIVKLWNLFNRQTWMKAESIIVLSSSMKERIVEACPEVADKIHIIHNWSDGDFIKPMSKKDNCFAQKNGFDQKFTILYSGNMGRCHDMKTIVEAADLLKDYQDKLQFVFIGSGAQQKPIQDKVNQLGLKNFSFLPYQKKEVLPYSLTSCDVSLISMAEGMEGIVAPSKIYSTLAAGKAVGVICPEKSFLKDLVMDAQCGESVRNGDAQGLADFLLMLSNNSSLCQKMGYNARQYFCSHFTKAIAISNYLKVIDKIELGLPQLNIV